MVIANIGLLKIVISTKKLLSHSASMPTKSSSINLVSIVDHDIRVCSLDFQATTLTSSIKT